MPMPAWLPPYRRVECAECTHIHVHLGHKIASDWSAKLKTNLKTYSTTLYNIMLSACSRFQHTYNIISQICMNSAFVYLCVHGMLSNFTDTIPLKTSKGRIISNCQQLLSIINEEHATSKYLSILFRRTDTFLSWILTTEMRLPDLF